MKRSKQKFDVKNDTKMKRHDGRIKLFLPMKTINLPKIRLMLLNYNLSKNDKFKK